MTVAEAEAPILWPPDMKSRLTGKEGKRSSGQQRMRWLVGIIDPVDMSLSKLWEIAKDVDAWRAAAHRIEKSQT